MIDQRWTPGDARMAMPPDIRTYRRLNDLWKRLAAVAQSWPQVLGASAIVLLVSLACMPVSEWLGYRSIPLFLLLIVSLLPLRFGPVAVYFAAGMAALSWNYLYIPPRFTMNIGQLEDLLLIAVFFVVAIVSGILTGRLTLKERRSASLYALTKELSSTRTQQAVLAAGMRHIAATFDANVVLFLGEPDGDIAPMPHAASTWAPNDAESRLAAWSYWNEQKAGRGTSRHPEALGLYLPMTGPRYPLGVVGVRTREGQRGPLDDALLENFVAQIGLACERELLTDLHQRSLIVAESERLMRTLLNSMSHEFRTPLASILGSAENLLAATSTADGRTTLLAHEIHRAASRLDRLVANLLDMTRLESGRLQLRRDWVDLGDIVSATVRDLRDDLAGRMVRIQPPEGDLPLVQADFGLLQQAVTNVVHNAVVHTPEGTPIDLAFGRNDEAWFIRVTDHGAGIEPADLPRVFDKFYRAPSAHAAGTGLGLTIARGFAEAHGGSLTVRNVDGGAEFTIRLPASDDTTA